MSKTSYSGISMDHLKVRSALEMAGVEGLTEDRVNEKHLRYGGTFNAARFMVNIFMKDNGKCTIGHTAGFDRDAYDVLAPAIAKHCRYGEKTTLELSVSNFKVASQTPFIEYLKNLGATVELDEVHAYFRQIRIKGPRGDTLTVKFYSNSTIQVQGNHAQLAVWVLEFLRTVLPLDKMLEHQRAVYKIPGTLETARNDLIARVPNVHDALAEEVRMQLSSALSMTKAGVVLEDYAALAFPALKGLEGLCFQLLREECQFSPVKKSTLSDYFDMEGLGFKMRVPHSEGVPIPVQKLLVQCYGMWYDQRHRLFHMDGTLETSRILDDRDDAIAIVNRVLDVIDQGYAEILMLKGKP
ncbi:putative cell division protein [Polaromonas sp. CG9_12]|nr:putative cell division protein [Polaromonas sp. CG9_12]